MFGWDFQHKSDRIKLFAFLLVIFLVISFGFSWLLGLMGQPPNADKESDIKEEIKITNDTYVTKEQNPYDQSGKFTESDLKASQETAKAFVNSYHSYDSSKPTIYLDAIQPFITDKLYERFKRNQRRETLDRSILKVKSMEIIPVSNQSDYFIRWTVMVNGEAISVDKHVTETEDWYLVSLKNIDGKWIVEDVKINEPN